jgi:hypothetical protein
MRAILIDPEQPSPGERLLELVRELMTAHPDATVMQLFELYCTRVKAVPELVDAALSRSFDADLADIGDLDWAAAKAAAQCAADRGVTALMKQFGDDRDPQTGGSHG